MASHDRTLAAIFAEPTPSNIRWKDIESLFASLGATIAEAEGSRVRVRLGGLRATFHRPHPGKEASRPTVRQARDMLRDAGHSPGRQERGR